MQNKIKVLLIGLVVVVVLIGVVTAPFLTIAAANTLFSLNIAYNFWTWLSVVWFNLLAYGISTNGARLLKKQ